MKRKSYRKDYMLTHDIDWFFQCKGKVYHVASNGGIIPKEIMARENAELQEKVYNYTVSNESECIINRNFIQENILNDLDNEYPSCEQQFSDYIESFVAMAKKGFISLDRSIDNRYFWVAKPKEDNTYNEFFEIQKGIVQFEEMPIQIVEQ